MRVEDYLLPDGDGRSFRSARSTTLCQCYGASWTKGAQDGLHLALTPCDDVESERLRAANHPRRESLANLKGGGGNKFRALPHVPPGLAAGPERQHTFEASTMACASAAVLTTLPSSSWMRSNLRNPDFAAGVEGATARTRAPSISGSSMFEFGSALFCRAESAVSDDIEIPR